ncbi:MAG: ROK family protein [Planctomycetota bacterium]
MIGNMKLMKSLNCARILSLLRERGTLSRVRLKELTGLDGTTITNLARELLAKKMVASRGYGESRGGRRAELLALNADWKLAMGLYLGPGRIFGALVNLGGEIRGQAEARLGSEERGGKGRAAIRSLARRLAKGARGAKILGAGLAVTGMLDRERRTLIQSEFFPELEGTDLAEFLGTVTRGPAEVDVSSRCLALGELRFGAARGIENFVMLELGRGIGCTIVTDGRLGRGSSGGAGELGHTIVLEGGPRCRCGHRGCLETVASVDALERDARKALGRESLEFREIVSMCEEGREEVREVVRQAGHYVGVSASYIVNVLNPSHIVVGGELAQLGAPLMGAIDEALRSYSMGASYEALSLVGAALSEDLGAATGAAALLIDKVFEVPGVIPGR